MKYFPLTFTPEKNEQVVDQTNIFLDQHEEIRNELFELLCGYHSIGTLIPQTQENLWSGHFFPYKDSWEEMQISLNLCYSGFYKQAFVSLRICLELGLLSVYYNINNDGHIVVKDWFQSQDSWEANTPKTSKIWEILRSNHNIKKFDDKLKIRERFDCLAFLHNYVHTKGYKYSNSLGIFKSNTQTFEEQIFLKWIFALKEIIIIVITLHLLKYPIGFIKYDWYSKFGIDIPCFGGLSEFQIYQFESILPKEFCRELEKISLNDKQTQALFNWIKEKPDLTDEEQENQIIEFDKSCIENGEGYIKWKERELETLEKVKDKKVRETIQSRIKTIEKWAVENDMMKPKMERLGVQDS